MNSELLYAILLFIVNILICKWLSRNHHPWLDSSSSYTSDMYDPLITDHPHLDRPLVIPHPIGDAFVQLCSPQPEPPQ